MRQIPSNRVSFNSNFLVSKFHLTVFTVDSVDIPALYQPVIHILERTKELTKLIPNEE